MLTGTTSALSDQLGIRGGSEPLRGSRKKKVKREEVEIGFEIRPEKNHNLSEIDERVRAICHYNGREWKSPDSGIKPYVLIPDVKGGG